MGTNSSLTMNGTASDTIAAAIMVLTFLENTYINTGVYLFFCSWGTTPLLFGNKV